MAALSLAHALRTIAWEDDHVVILDQTALPSERRDVFLRTIEDAFVAIRDLQVRGAPLIGVSAAFGLYLGMREALANQDADPARELARCSAYLAGARPTAVNLTWALQQAMRDVAPLLDSGDSQAILARLLRVAQGLLDADVATNRALGLHGLPLLRGTRAILTHCNAGWLATAGFGSALAPLYALLERGEEVPRVYVDETRPILQGARLTAWELEQAGVPVTLICDNMAATVLSQGRVDAVLVGCDRMAANGDFANKIGTLGVAILAREFGVPFYAGVPTSSIDFALATGAEIQIEERAADEVRRVGGRTVAPEVDVYNPAFDVTPHRYLSAVITERGIVTPPFDAGLARLRDLSGEN